jgi:hypothetical protein
MAVKPQPASLKALVPFELSIWAKKLLVFRRFAAWGGAAALALTIVVLISQTPAGSERLELVLARARTPEPQAIVSVPPRVVVDAEETRRLADEMRRLAADRDRLKERVANLEHSFDDMTGSIKTVMLANAAAQSVKDEPKESKEKVAAAPPPPQVAAPAAMPAPTAAPPPPAAAKPTEPAPPAAAPPVAPGQTEIVPMPPVRVASTLPEAPADPAKVDFAVDLGGRLSMNALRQHWLTVKANNGPLLAGLRPLVTQRVRASGTDYRLVLGPLPSAVDAAKLCAKFTAAHATCRTGKFIGEELALP